MPAHTIDEEAKTIADLGNILYRRRAVRAYTPDVVPEATIRALLDAAVHAPTAMHQEPWRFVIVQNRELLKRISDRAKAMVVDQAEHHGNLLKPPGAAGDGIASLLADPEFNIFYDAGTLVIIGATPANEFVAADCWLAAENLMLSARAHGLATCVIGFAVPALNTPEIKAELKIPPTVHVFAPIIVGVERGDTPSVPRKSAVVLNWVHS